MKENQKRIECKNGASVSIQGSQFAYCHPRDDEGPYLQVEAGFPSVEPPASWMEYVEDSDRPLDTIYAYMPIKVAYEFIEANGGAVGDVWFMDKP